MEQVFSPILFLETSSRTPLTSFVVPHGGFITAVFLRVAALHFSTTLSSQNQPHTIALHLSFLRRTQNGPALFTVKDTKIGRQTSVIHITLTQENREEVVGYITNSNILSEDGVTFTTGWKLDPPPTPVNLALLKDDKDANWGRNEDMPFPALRHATRKTQFHFPRHGQRRKGTADEWVRLKGTEKWTNASLGYLADMWPMPVESLIQEQDIYAVDSGKAKPSAKPVRFWYPTVLLNLEVKKALPEDGVEWLFVRVDSKLVRNGRMDIEVVICDEGGDVVALSHHVALAVGLERNMKERNGANVSKI